MSRGGACEWRVRDGDEADLPKVIDELTDYMDTARRVKYRRKLTRYTRDEDKELLMAVDATGAIGFLCVAEHDEVPDTLPPAIAEQLKEYATVTSFIVRPEHRRRGVGMSLFTRALEWGKRRKLNGMWLITHRTGPWYHRHFGLEEVGKIDVGAARKTVMAKVFETT